MFSIGLFLYICLKSIKKSGTAIKYRITYRIHRHFINEKCTNELAVFLKWKHHFNNSCFFDYNYSKIGRQLGESRYKVRRYVKYFLKTGMCRERNGNLIFQPINVISKLVSEEPYQYDERLGNPQQNSITVTLKPKENTQKGIKDEILRKALKVKFDQCKFKAKKEQRSDLDTRSVRGIYEPPEQQGENSSGFQLMSYEGLHETIGLNPYPYIQKFLRNGWMKYRKGKTHYIGKVHYDPETYGKYYVHKGHLYKRDCNLYEIIPNVNSSNPKYGEKSFFWNVSLFTDPRGEIPRFPFDPNLSPKPFTVLDNQSERS